MQLNERNRSRTYSALTAMVFPGFFRARTIEMGRYIGIYHGRVLVAMAGERMRLDRLSGDQRESARIRNLSDAATRSDSSRWMTNSVLERGVTPFLHVHRENTRALSLYEYLGYRVRTEAGALVRHA